MRIVEGRVTGDVDAVVADLAAIGDRHGCAVQAFDARCVAGRRHLEAAVEHANRAVDREDAIADDRAVEILCYAAGRRQIERALAIGIPDDGGPVVVVVDGGDEGDAAAAVADLLEPEDTLGVARDDAILRDVFDVTDVESGATDASLEDLVVERVALLAVEK